MSIAVTNYLRHSINLRENFTVAQSLSCLCLQSFDYMALWQLSTLLWGHRTEEACLFLGSQKAKEERKDKIRVPMSILTDHSQ